MKQLYTVGHSTHELSDFIALLKKHNIDTIVDVRSTPYSQFASQYNREPLKDYLKDNQINYIFMGDSLGARHTDSTLLFEEGNGRGKVNFQKVQQTQSFQDAIARLEDGMAKGYKISLMCSEKEAFDCHRFGMISAYLAKYEVDVKHIYPDEVVLQQQMEEKLLEKYDKKMSKSRELFITEETGDSPLEAAYKLRNQDIGYNAITKEGNE